MLRSSKAFEDCCVSIRAPREGGDSGGNFAAHEEGVSIRAPREGGDEGCAEGFGSQIVSIRAPREGGDRVCVGVVASGVCFNPRPP